ncbi:paired amphipathic helix, partial [Obelidium mucronatum]
MAHHHVCCHQFLARLLILYPSNIASNAKANDTPSLIKPSTVTTPPANYPAERLKETSNQEAEDVDTPASARSSKDFEPTTTENPQQHQQQQQQKGSRSLSVKDAETYLDQAKSQLANQPNVFNRFEDIMRDFKSQTVDIPGVIDLVSNLFRDHPSLVTGFCTFLPPGYRIEATSNPLEPFRVI